MQVNIIITTETQRLLLKSLFPTDCVYALQLPVILFHSISHFYYFPFVYHSSILTICQTNCPTLGHIHVN